MNEEKKEPRKRGNGGRPPKNDPAKRRLTVNLTDTQHAGFLTLYEQSGVESLSGFIAARIFGDEFRVVKTDASAVEFIAKLTALHAQIRSIGVNYNQVVKELHSNFSEKKALALLYKREKITIERGVTNQKIITLSEELKRRAP